MNIRKISDRKMNSQFKLKPVKSLLQGSILLALGLSSGIAFAAPITDLPQYIQDKLPSNSFKNYTQQCDNCNVSGVYAWGNDILPIYGDNVTITGGTAQSLNHAVFVNGSMVSGFSIGVFFGDGLKITTSVADADGLRTHGVMTNKDDRAFIIAGDNTQITTTGSSADGINAGYTNYSSGWMGSAYIELGNNARIETSGDGAYGISANAMNEDRYNDVVLGNNATIITHGLSSYGIRAGGSTHSVVTLGNDASITTDGKSASALYAYKGTIILGDNAIITTKEGAAHGVYASSSGKITLGASAILKTEGEKSYTLYATGAASSITIGNDAELTTENTGSHLIYTTAKEGIIGLGDNSKLTSNGDNSYGIFVSGYRNAAGTTTNGNAKVTLGDNAQITTNGDTSHGVYMYGQDGKIILGDNAQVNTTGLGAHALYGHGSQATPNTSVYGDNGKIIVGNGTLLKTTGDNSHGTYVDWATSSIDFQGDTTISATGLDSYALYANAGTIKSTTAAKYNVTGDMRVDATGTIDLKMVDGSLFKGNTTVAEVGGVLNLDITGANSQWQMSQNSNLTTLNLSDNAKVFLGNQATSINAGNQIILTAETLTGSGVFNMRADIPNQIGDIIRITGSANGTHGIHVADHSTGGATVTGNEIVTLVEMADGTAQFGLLNKNGRGASAIDIGAYSYALNEKSAGGTAQEWYLSGSLIPVTPPVEPPVTPPVEPPVTPPVEPPVTPPVKPPVTPPLTNAANHSVNIFNINYLMNQAETHTLLQRMGELRESDTLGGVWVRGYGGKFNSFSSELQGFDFKYTGIQFGVDRLLSNEYGRFYVGAMAGYSDGEAKYRVGKGEVKSYHLGLYTTFKHSNGFYVDGLIKYNNMRNTFTTQTGSGYAVSGKGTTNGLSASLELGKRFYFQAKDNGWYIEPQAQISYAHQGSTTVRSSNNLKTRLESYDSLLGRMSVIVGYKISDGANPIDVYFKTGVVKEFNGKTSYTFNDSKRRNDYKFDGIWWDSAIGINAEFNKKHNLYLDVNYAAGSKFNKAQLNFGYRYEF